MYYGILQYDKLYGLGEHLGVRLAEERRVAAKHDVHDNACAGVIN